MCKNNNMQHIQKLPVDFYSSRLVACTCFDLRSTISMEQHAYELDGDGSTVLESVELLLIARHFDRPGLGVLQSAGEIQEPDIWHLDGALILLWYMKVSIDLHGKVSFSKRTEIKLGNPRPNASTRSSRPCYTICKVQWTGTSRGQHAG